MTCICYVCIAFIAFSSLKYILFLNICIIKELVYDSTNNLTKKDFLESWTCNIGYPHDMDAEDIELQHEDFLETDAAKDLRIRKWLLDAAIYQHSKTLFQSKKRRVYLPDEVFRDPGMSELEMLQYMKDRGASNGCIKFARSKYREANKIDLDITNISTSGSCGHSSEVMVSVDSGMWSEQHGNESSCNGERSRLGNLVFKFKTLFS